MQGTNGVDESVGIIDVIHSTQGVWHKFTSPQIPGLYMVVAGSDLERAYADIPKAIAELIFNDAGRRPVVQHQMRLDVQPD